MIIENNCLVCKICEREITDKSYWDEHHLIPKAKGGKYSEKVKLHRICHEKIHSLWTEAELANIYNTVESILTNQSMISFVKWVKKKSPEFYVKTKLNNNRKY